MQEFHCRRHHDFHQMVILGYAAAFSARDIRLYRKPWPNQTGGGMRAFPAVRFPTAFVAFQVRSVLVITPYDHRRLCQTGPFVLSAFLSLGYLHLHSSTAGILGHGFPAQLSALKRWLRTRHPSFPGVSRLTLLPVVGKRRGLSKHLHHSAICLHTGRP